jgi:hypothetical protein
VDDPATAFFCSVIEVDAMPSTSEDKIQPDATVTPAATSQPSNRKTILALSVFALGLNATAAVYTASPSEFALPDVSGILAELLPHQKGPDPIEGIVARLKDIQLVQYQQASDLQQNTSLLQQHTALLQQNAAQSRQDSETFDALRHSLTDGQVNAKKVSGQLSTLISKVDSLQATIATEITSSIPKGRARARLSAMARKKMARQSKPVGPVSVGGAPLTTAPAGLVQRPEG